VEAAVTTPSPEQVQIAPWMLYARRELGVREVKGDKHNARILEYIAACDRGTRPWLAKDETYWCSAFACWSMHEAHIASTRSLGARSWLDYGDAIELDDARYGDILVFWRGIKLPAKVRNAPAHVAFFDRWTDESRKLVDALGGNQGNVVSIASKPVRKLLGIRRPTADDLALFNLMARSR
jgi:uncharacterized protein (TIGR02594 family)